MCKESAENMSSIPLNLILRNAASSKSFVIAEFSIYSRSKFCEGNIDIQVNSIFFLLQMKPWPSPQSEVHFWKSFSMKSFISHFFYEKKTN